MEQVQSLMNESKVSWFDKRCRELVHSVFSNLTYGQLEIVEGSKHTFYPAEVSANTLKAKIHILDMSVYREFVKGGSIGVAESFIEGQWTSPNLTNVIRIFAKAQQLTDKLDSNKTIVNKIKNAISHWKNRNTQSGSKKNILAHYDLGNELYTRF